MRFYKTQKMSLTTNHEQRKKNMNDLIKQMEMESQKKSSVSRLEQADTSEYKTVASLARQIQDEEEYISSLEKDLKGAKKKLTQLTEHDLPSLLEEIGMLKFELNDGSKVIVQQIYSASIPVANRPKAFQWLRDKGYGDIIKNVISCEFGMGEDQKAHDFRDTATQNGFEIKQNTTVHSSTLKSFVKERCDKGDEFPMDLFGAYIGQKAKITKGSK